MRKCVWITILCLSILLVSLTGVLWFGPSGTGEYKESPDGRYTAHAAKMTRGTWLDGRREYLELEVIESSTQRVLWQVEYHPQPGDAPDYGDRSQRFITWTADSSSVRFPIGSDEQITLPVPSAR
jgi:hypothetical protein